MQTQQKVISNETFRFNPDSHQMNNRFQKENIFIKEADPFELITNYINQIERLKQELNKLNQDDF
jgi:hypothetical protein